MKECDLFRGPDLITHGCKAMPCILDSSTNTYCIEHGYNHALWDMDWSRDRPQYLSVYSKLSIDVLYLFFSQYVNICKQTSVLGSTAIFLLLHMFLP